MASIESVKDRGVAEKAKELVKKIDAAEKEAIDVKAEVEKKD